MGLLYCTGCMSDCRLEVLRSELEARRSFLVLACGFLDENHPKPKQVPVRKLQRLADYFNQRRDRSRSTISMVAFDLDDGFARCKAEFLHDVGMLSPEPVTVRKSPF